MGLTMSSTAEAGYACTRSGHINWLLYAKQPGPIAGEKKITRPGTAAEISEIEAFLRKEVGAAMRYCLVLTCRALY